MLEGNSEAMKGNLKGRLVPVGRRWRMTRGLCVMGAPDSLKQRHNEWSRSCNTARGYVYLRYWADDWATQVTAGTEVLGTLTAVRHEMGKSRESNQQVCDQQMI
jgi:hypothetical protein